MVDWTAGVGPAVTSSLGVNNDFVIFVIIEQMFDRFRVTAEADFP